MIEIERKYLLSAEQAQEAIAGASVALRMVQGYLSTDPHRTVRVRIQGEQAYLTVKGIGSVSGLSRFEWEKEIGVEEASALLGLCQDTLVEKTRYEVIYRGVCFEVDCFEGRHQGLFLAEVELEQESQEVELPSWIGREVTGDPQYCNSTLSQAQL